MGAWSLPTSFSPEPSCLIISLPCKRTIEVFCGIEIDERQQCFLVLISFKPSYLLFCPIRSPPIPSNPVSCNYKVEACGDNPQIGYTTDYVPEASIPLDEQYDAALIEGDDIDIIDSDFSLDCTLYLGE